MLYTIAVVLIIMWLLGLFTAYIAGGNLASMARIKKNRSPRSPVSLLPHLGKLPRQNPKKNT